MLDECKWYIQLACWIWCIVTTASTAIYFNHNPNPNLWLQLIPAYFYIFNVFVDYPLCLLWNDYLNETK